MVLPESPYLKFVTIASRFKICMRTMLTLPAFLTDFFWIVDKTWPFFSLSSLQLNVIIKEHL